MSALTAGYIGVAVMLILLFLGMPLAYTFALSGVFGITLILGLNNGLNYMMSIPFSAAASYTFIVMPLFMLMGDFAYNGGLTSDAYGAARKWFGHVPGGLAVTSTVASAMFGALCGSGSTTALVMTQVAWPEMKESGYDPGLGLGSIVGAGPLAILIPPSGTLILYGIIFILMEQTNRRRNFPISRMSRLDYRTAVLIGVFQCLALIPGTSRSGATILGAMLLGCSRPVAAEFSFFLGIPVMFGASLLKIVKHGFGFTPFQAFELLFGMAVSFLVALYTIRFLMKYIRRNDFTVFGYYRIVLGIIVLVWFTALGH